MKAHEVTEKVVKLCETLDDMLDVMATAQPKRPGRPAGTTRGITKRQLSITVSMNLYNKMQALKKKGTNTVFFIEEALGAAVRSYENSNGKLTDEDLTLPSEK